MKSLIKRNKGKVVFTVDCIAIALTFIFSFQLRLGDFYPLEISNSDFKYKLLIVIVSQIIVFWAGGFYKGIWRFSSINDLVRIVRGVSISIPVSFSVLFLFKQLNMIPRSVFLIQWFLLIVTIGGTRFAYRLYRDRKTFRLKRNTGNLKNILIVGAGYGGQQLLRDLKDDVASKYNVVGFIDDDFYKRGKIIHGVKVYGNVNDIAQIAKKLDAKQVIIAIPTATKEQLSLIVEACKGTNLSVKSIPKLTDLISGKLQITKLRKVTPSDLLGRDQVDLNMQSMSHMLTDKTIFISGAGGSIGSELCFQIAKFKPKKIICYDISEYNLYELSFKLNQFIKFTDLKFVVGDVRDEFKVDGVFDKNRPDIVFHAAAYKHVPLMEMNPLEAIKVNILGTKIMAEIANKYKLQKFVMISTDKAVNPTNVMGTTKRIAEMVCQAIQVDSKTKYEIVRFGNVLGSSGSVIPRFQKQIEDGGPVTVTHPDIIRYFMSIPEAAQLVIQAGAIGSGGEIFVLDMGEPVKIVDLAKQMITLAGLKVNDDVEIAFTGLRPGEKLFEELLSDSENTLPTVHERVRVAKVREVDSDLFEKISNLFNAENDKNIRVQLKQLVPEYDIPEELDKKIVEYSKNYN